MSRTTVLYLLIPIPVPTFLVLDPQDGSAVSMMA